MKCRCYQKAHQRRVIRVSEMFENIEAAGTPDPNEVSGRYAPDRGCQRQLTGVKIVAKKKLGGQPSLFLCLLQAKQIYLLSAVATSTAQATVLPTIGLLPIPRNPIKNNTSGPNMSLVPCQN